MTAFVYICSPYGGIRENAVRAREYGKVVAEEGYMPIIPHVMWHGIFKDSVADERERAIAAGLELLKHCDELRYFGNEITPGMAQEINYARAHGIPVVKGQACSRSELGEVLRFFEENFLFLNRTVADILRDYMEQGITAGLLKEAIKITAKKSAGVNYLEGILNNWVARKIFTIENLKSQGNSKPETTKNEYSDYIASLNSLED
ncbi:MAG: DnaD domain protein [Ruminococcaceae bacterium]|nr:DnaD domain protein [Oscillospiraceae bacterium]